jgi:hypothetical protein
MESSASHPLVASGAVTGSSVTPLSHGPLSGGAMPTRFEAPAAVVRMLKVMLGVGVVTLLAGLMLVPERAAANLLIGAYYVLSLGLGGVLLIAIEYVTGAGWSVAFRRVPEAMAKTLPAGAALLLIVLALSHRIYPWFHDAHGSAPEAAWFREMWLTPLFFYARSVVYLAAWIFFAHQLVARSRRQDDDGAIEHTRSNARWSAAFLVVFGYTLWLATTDWIMSLEPHWYSTIFSVYHFAGLFIGALAMTAIIAIWLERLGPLRGVLTSEHLHDLGKLIFAFSTFWMYIWFSQYMLIWYANIPEETVYFTRRLAGFWEPLFFLNFLLNWAVPFFVLLSVKAKRNPSLLLKVCWTILVGRWVDLYWMVMPPFTEGNPTFGIWEIGIALGAAGAFFLALFRALSAAPAVPIRDPLLPESLHYHN